MKKKAALGEKKEDSATTEDPKGIPEFWLTIFKHVDMLGEMLQVNRLTQFIHKNRLTETLALYRFLFLLRLTV